MKRLVKYLLIIGVIVLYTVNSFGGLIGSILKSENLYYRSILLNDDDLLFLDGDHGRGRDYLSPVILHEDYDGHDVYIYNINDKTFTCDALLIDGQSVFLVNEVPWNKIGLSDSELTKIVHNDNYLMRAVTTIKSTEVYLKEHNSFSYYYVVSIIGLVVLIVLQLLFVFCHQSAGVRIVIYSLNTVLGIYGIVILVELCLRFFIV